MDTVKLGVIGCGGMCRNHLATVGGKDKFTSEALRPFAERTEVRALCDVDRDHAEGFMADYGGAYATDDAARVFADPDVDAVVIATWHDTHAPLSMQALEAGKHVVIEKPMCMTEAECDQIVEAADRTGLAYMPAFRARFAAGTRDVKAQIPKPDNVIACARTRGIWPEHIWAQDPIKGGGQILSQGCHIVDLMFYLAGDEPESVYAAGGVFHHSKPDPVDTINATIRYRGGGVGAFMGGDGGTGNLLMHQTLPNHCDFYVMVSAKGRTAVVLDHGENACFESCVDDWTPPYDAKVYGQQPGDGPASGLPDLLPSFARAILEGEAPLATALDGARATRFIRKCFQSARTGQVVSM